jgi:hypothetical protein
MQEAANAAQQLAAATAAEVCAKKLTRACPKLCTLIQGRGPSWPCRPQPCMQYVFAMRLAQVAVPVAGQAQRTHPSIQLLQHGSCSMNTSSRRCSHPLNLPCME